MMLKTDTVAPIPNASVRTTEHENPRLLPSLRNVCRISPRCMGKPGKTQTYHTEDAQPRDRGTDDEQTRSHCCNQAIALKTPGRGQDECNGEWLLKNSIFSKTTEIWGIENV